MTSFFNKCLINEDGVMTFYIQRVKGQIHCHNILHIWYSGEIRLCCQVQCVSEESPFLDFGARVQQKSMFESL